MPLKNSFDLYNNNMYPMKSEYKSVYAWFRGRGIRVSDFIKTLQESIFEFNKILNSETGLDRN